MNTQNQFQCGLFSAGKKPFTVSNTGEYTHCSTVSLSDNTSWVFRLRDASYIKKKLQSSCGLWAQTKMEAQKRRKRWASNLMKCNKCSIACTRKVQLLLHLQSQHIEHQKNINDLSEKSHKTFCQYFADKQIDWLKLLHGN